MPEIIITGPEGRLEARYQRGKETNAPIALMLHPHPQHGGTMNNKIVYNLFHTFLDRGFSVLRFNFRGVGRSQGQFDRGEGELSDAAAALDWLQQTNPAAPACWVAGFSFGAWIGMQLLMRRPEITSFISVAPPANLYDFGFLAPCPSSGLIIQGDADKIVPSESVAKLVQKLSHQRGISIDYRLIKGADHFFGDHMDDLTQAAGEYLDKILASGIPQPPRPKIKGKPLPAAATQSLGGAVRQTPVAPERTVERSLMGGVVDLDISLASMAMRLAAQNLMAKAEKLSHKVKKEPPVSSPSAKDEDKTENVKSAKPIAKATQNAAKKQAAKKTPGKAAKKDKPKSKPAVKATAKPKAKTAAPAKAKAKPAPAKKKPQAKVAKAPKGKSGKPRR